jgi:hypothetical protein
MLSQSPLPVEQCCLRMPHVEKGMAVGLFGGSFNPPHAGLESSKPLKRRFESLKSQLRILILNRR